MQVLQQTPAWSVLLVTLTVSGISTESAADSVKVEEWQVPYADSRPRDPYVAPDGRVWFCGQLGAYIAVLDPDTGEFTQYPMPDNERPHNLLVDHLGMIWFAGNTLGYIGRLNPEDGSIKRFKMPDGVRDPHTLVFDQKGDIWFTSQHSNHIGRLSLRTGQLEIAKISTPSARPYGIKIDADGRPWVALFGSHKLATVDPASFTVTEVDLPRDRARPRRLEITPDGAIWYVDYRDGYLGQYLPGSQQFSEWLLPSGENSRPYGTAIDDHGRVWIAETGPQPNRLVGFDPDSKTFIEGGEIPSGGGTVRYMYRHPASGSIWFGADSNTIGRFQP